MADHSPTRLDLYLPPPSHRAYRWGRVQRLRDQITAWRRPAAGESGPAGSFAPRWRTANPGRLRGFGASIARTPVPYFHDQTHFCGPGPGPGPGPARRMADMCYGVTTNREEAALAAKDTGDASASGAAQYLMLNPSFAVKARSVEVATIVHAELTQHAESADTRAFARTMEIPVDWEEFERTGNTRMQPFPPIVQPPASFAATAPVARAWDSFGSSERRPLRLYTIHMPSAIEVSAGSMARAVAAPRCGEHVSLPKK